MEDERGKRILHDLNSAFNRDPNIDEYDFIPVLEPMHNRKPLILREHKLGLELWCVKLLFHYSYNKLMQWKMKELDRRTLDPLQLIHLSRAALLVNPECATIWNIRKKLVKDGDLTENKDLRLGMLILTKHPKSAETFAHRKWLLQRLYQTKSQPVWLYSQNQTQRDAGELDSHDPLDANAIDVDLDINRNGKFRSEKLGANAEGDEEEDEEEEEEKEEDCLSDEVVQTELAVCRLAADRYPSNYNAWSHRIWLIQNVCRCRSQVLLSELQATEEWNSTHISDHSGFHYRQFLLGQLGEGGAGGVWCSRSSLYGHLQHDLELTSGLINSYPGHEAIWCHRRYIVQALARAMGEQNSQSSASQTQHEGLQRIAKKTKLEQDASQLAKSELQFAQTAMKDKRSYQKVLAERHKKWLQKVLLAEDR